MSIMKKSLKKWLPNFFRKKQKQNQQEERQCCPCGLYCKYLLACPMVSEFEKKTMKEDMIENGVLKLYYPQSYATEVMLKDRIKSLGYYRDENDTQYLCLKLVGEDNNLITEFKTNPKCP